MRIIVISFCFVFFLANLRSQNPSLEEVYLTNNNKNISCTAINYAAEEIANSRKSKMSHEEYEFISSPSELSEFMQSYDKKVKEDNNKEIWLTVKYEAGRTAKDYLIDKVEDIADYLPGPFEEAVDVGLSLVSNASDAVLDYSKEQAENEIWIERGNALSDGIEVLAMNGQLKGLNNSEISKALKELTYENISPEDQAFANKGISRWMLDYVAQNENQLIVLKEKYENISARQVDVEQKQKEFSENIKKDFDSFKKKTAKNFKDVYGSVMQLTRNQEELNLEMNAIRDNVIRNSKRIKQNENKINENRKLGLNNRKLIETNREFIEENRNLIVSNKGQINILQGYMYGSLDVSKQIRVIEKGELGTNLWSAKDRTQALKALNKKKTIETINDIGRTSMTVLSKGFKIGDNLGLFESEDGKKVDKVLDYTIKGINVGIGLASGFGGNPMGFLDAALGITSFFSEPKPSPEMQMLEKIAGKLNSMDTKLDSLCIGQLEIKAQLFFVSEKLDTLLHKVYELQKDVYELRIDMYKSFNFVFEQMDEIERKIDVVDLKTNEILLENYQLCPQIFEDYDFVNMNYKDLQRISESSSDLKYCMKGISTHLSQTGNEITSKVLMSTYLDPNNKNLIDFEITNIFIPTLELHNYINKNNPIRSIPLLQPSSKFNGYYSLFSSSKNIELFDKNDFIYPKYLNANAVLKIAEFYLLALPLYEFENPSNGSLYTLEEWLSKDSYLRQGKYDIIIKRLRKLLQIINFSIVQNNMIAGSSINKSIYFNLFENRLENPELIKKIKLLVQDNPYLQHNLMNMLVKNKISGHSEIESYNKLYSENLGEKIKLSQLLNDDFFNDIEVYLPEYNFAIISDFTYPQELYELVEFRNVIESKIIDYELLSGEENIFKDDIIQEIKINLLRSKMNFEYLSKN